MGSKTSPSSRSVMEIISSIQRSKIGIQDWSLSDLTVGLYLLYLRQASANPFEDVKGVQISSNSIVITCLMIAIPFLIWTIFACGSIKIIIRKKPFS